MNHNKKQDSTVQVSKLIAASEKINKAKICSVSGLLEDSCSKRIARAHSISKSASLREIAQRGHVLTGNSGLMALKKNKNKAGLREIGIADASVFTGFCTHHDTQVFVPLETKQFVSSLEQLFLLAYRPVARELYIKNGVKQAQEAAQAPETWSGATVAQILQYEATARFLRASNTQTIQDLAYIKAILDRALVDKGFGCLRHFVIGLSAVPKIMASSIFIPYRDFNGVPLQSPQYGAGRGAYVIVNSVALDKQGYVILSWLPDDDATIAVLIDSLTGLAPREIGDALARFILTMSENVYLSPTWHRSLDADQKTAISDMINETDLSDTLTIWSEGIPLAAMDYTSSASY